MKIYGEHTRPTDEPMLCATCRRAIIVRGTRFGDDLIKCGPVGNVTFKVTECSAYDDARLTPVWELEQTAWRWMSTRFVSPKEFARLEDHDDDPPVIAPAAPPDTTKGSD